MEGMRGCRDMGVHARADEGNVEGRQGSGKGSNRGRARSRARTDDHGGAAVGRGGAVVSGGSGWHSCHGRRGAAVRWSEPTMGRSVIGGGIGADCGQGRRWLDADGWGNEEGPIVGRYGVRVAWLLCGGVV